MVVAAVGQKTANDELDQLGLMGKERVRTEFEGMCTSDEKVFAAGGTLAITADHGNAEMMVDPDSGEPHTAHTLNPVPFLLMGEPFGGANLREIGVLGDVAPTLMEAMGIEQPAVMDGQSLLRQ